MTRLMLGLVLVPVALLAVLAGTLIANRAPLLAPPGLLTRLAAYLGSNVVETTSDSPYPERRSMRLRVPAAQFIEAGAAVIRGLGWQQPEGATDALHWIVRTPLLGFTDDVVLRLRSDSRGDGWLDLRSASRVGRGDLAANTRHLMQLRAALEQAGLVEPPSRRADR